MVWHGVDFCAVYRNDENDEKCRVGGDGDLGDIGVLGAVAVGLGHTVLAVRRGRRQKVSRQLKHGRLASGKLDTFR